MGVTEAEASHVAEQVHQAAEDAGWTHVSLRIDSLCLKMPAAHTMTRSELDPMYGSSDPLYPNDDRSKFTNGEPKPLPE